MPAVIDMDALAVKPTLRGKRVVLVPLAERHAEAFFASVRDPELRRLTGTHVRHSQESVREFCASRAALPDRLDLAVEDPDTGDFLGELALIEVDAANESADFRIALQPEQAGRGLGGEVMALVLEYAFERVGLHRVRLEVFTYNHRAIRAYEKAGFTREGVQREALNWQGERHDVIVMGVLRNDPRPAA